MQGGRCLAPALQLRCPAMLLWALYTCCCCCIGFAGLQGWLLLPLLLPSCSKAVGAYVGRTGNWDKQVRLLLLLVLPVCALRPCLPLQVPTLLTQNPCQGLPVSHGTGGGALACCNALRRALVAAQQPRSMTRRA